MAYKFYAVKVGREPGVYTSWQECNAQVSGFPNPVFKGFDSEDDATAFVDGRLKVHTAKSKSAEDIAAAKAKRKIPPSKQQGVTRGEKGFDEKNPPPAYAFVDGSYNKDTGIYGYGGFLISGDDEYVLQGSGEGGKSWNIDGEIAGSMAAVEMGIELGLDGLVIYHDLEHTAKWATGEYKAASEIAKMYVDFIKKAAKKITLHFEKVKGHSNLPGNDRADALAKEAAGNLN